MQAKLVVLVKLLGEAIPKFEIFLSRNFSSKK